ncbi:MAG: methyltransferase domain-containing protein [Desulfobaccales bacterium]
MNSSRSVVVVGPGCSAGLLRELLDSQILPVPKNVEVLLAPGLLPDRSNLTGGEIFFAASPGRRFLSTSHFKWLKCNLRSAHNILMLLPKSPYQDPAIALVSLLILWWSGKTVTLLRPAPATERETLRGEGRGEAQGSDGPWLFTELNQGFLSQELRDLAWASYPGFLKKFFTFIERELRYYFEAYQTDPVNLQPLDASPAALERDVDYAMGTAAIWIDFLPGNEGFLKGKKVLEIGPGVNFGNILALSCHGAEVLVADRFLSPWDPEYHPKFYALLKERVKERWPLSDLTLLDTILSRGGYPRDSIAIYTSSLEELSGVPDQSVDLIISNAVFEHLYDIESAFANLARITRPGGLGLHQVDFRDHRDTEKPLEYLLLSDRDFSRVFKERHGECGNRFRPREMQKIFERVGFEVIRFMPNLDAEAAYLADFLRRLPQARKSRYRDYKAEDLNEISGLFTVAKKPDLGD